MVPSVFVQVFNIFCFLSALDGRLGMSDATRLSGISGPSFDSLSYLLSLKAVAAAKKKKKKKKGRREKTEELGGIFTTRS